MEQELVSGLNERQLFCVSHSQYGQQDGATLHKPKSVQDYLKARFDHRQDYKILSRRRKCRVQIPEKHKNFQNHIECEFTATLSQVCIQHDEL